MTVKQEYTDFLNTYFEGHKIRQPLFYNWESGLRFNLQVGQTNTDEYFEKAINRASSLFEAAFNPTDEVFFILMDYKYKRQKISFSNYCFKQIESLKKEEICYAKAKRLYEYNDRFDIRNVAVLAIQTSRINYRNVIKAIAYTDFPPRKPSLGFLTSKEIYFINIDKKIIFNMYDDRGLDIIASDKKVLLPIYNQYEDWILDYDRELIDQRMKKVI